MCGTTWRNSKLTMCAIAFVASVLFYWPNVSHSSLPVEQLAEAEMQDRGIPTSDIENKLRSVRADIPTPDIRNLVEWTDAQRVQLETPSFSNTDVRNIRLAFIEDAAARG